MKKESITKEVFISDDGVQFNTEAECLNHENKLKNIKHYRIMYDPDLNETGLLCKSIYVAILYDKNPTMSYDILLEYIYRNFKCILGPGVQGCGMLRHVSFSECSKDEYMKHHQGQWIMLSDVKLEGYPEPVNFLKKWGFDQ